MTEKEILNLIKKERRRIETLKNKICSVRDEIAGCRKAISFWKEELAKVKRNGTEG